MMVTVEGNDLGCECLKGFTFHAQLSADAAVDGRELDRLSQVILETRDMAKALRFDLGDHKYKECCGGEDE